MEDTTILSLLFKNKILLKSTFTELFNRLVDPIILSRIIGAEKYSAHLFHGARLSLLRSNTIKCINFILIFLFVLCLSQSYCFRVSLKDVLLIIHRFLICDNQMLLVLAKLQESVKATKVLHHIINRIIILFYDDLVFFEDLFKVLYLLQFGWGYLTLPHGGLVAFSVKFQKSPIIGVHLFLNLYWWISFFGFFGILIAFEIFSPFESWYITQSMNSALSLPRFDW